MDDMQARPTGTDIAVLVGRPDDPDAIALAGAYVPLVWDMAHNHTRGEGFTPDAKEAHPAIVAAVKLAVIRLVANPTQTKRYQVGEYSETPTVFQGFNLAELSVLNSYRVRAL